MKYIELTTLRVVAIILIVNSHLTLFYPYEYFATGGALGNAIFFFISGVGLSYSLTNNKIKFLNWIRKRYLRVYPKLLFIVVLYISIKFIEINNLQQFLIKIVFPVEFWFLPVLTYFYLFIYFIAVNFNIRNLIYLLLIILLFYLFNYNTFVDSTIYSIENNIFFKSIFYFFIINLGVLTHKTYNKFNFNISTSTIIFFSSIISYYYLKYLMLVENLYFYQFLEHLFIIIIVLSLFYLLKNKKLINIQKNKYFEKYIFFVGGMSLEIYLIHAYFKNYPISTFPFNILIFTILVLIASFLFKLIFLKLFKLQ